MPEQAKTMTPEEIEIEETCKRGVEQKMKQAAAEADAKAAEALAKASQDVAKTQAELAKIPESLISDLDAAMKKLMSIISGYEDPKSPDFDPDKVIAQVKAALDPVVEGISSLPVPEIPGLTDITALLDKLSAFASSKPQLSESDISEKIPDMPEMPTKMFVALTDLLVALQSLCATLPMVMVNLVFDMMNVIVSNFEMIKSAIGVPPIPPPLSMVPDCIKLGPKVVKLITTLPGQVSPMIQGAILKKYREIAALKLPPDPIPPVDTPVPDPLPTCPNHA